MLVEMQTSGIHGKYVITNCEDFDFYIFMFYDLDMEFHLN